VHVTQASTVPFDVLGHPTIYVEDLVLVPHLELPELDDPELSRVFLLTPESATPQVGWCEAYLPEHNQVTPRRPDPR
jgi:hypothetical protein